MSRFCFALVLLTALAATSFGDDKAPPTDNKFFRNAVPKAWTSFEPSTAKRGETVTWRLTVELAPGWHTYPLQQVDPKAEDIKE